MKQTDEWSRMGFNEKFAAVQMIALQFLIIAAAFLGRWKLVTIFAVLFSSAAVMFSVERIVRRLNESDRIAALERRCDANGIYE